MMSSRARRLAPELGAADTLLAPAIANAGPHGDHIVERAAAHMPKLTNGLVLDERPRPEADSENGTGRTFLLRAAGDQEKFWGGH